MTKNRGGIFYRTSVNARHDYTVSEIRWCRIVTVNGTIEIKSLVSDEPKNVQLRELVVPGCVNWQLYASASEDLLHDNTTDSELCKLTCSAQHSLNFIIDILTEIKQRCCLIGYMRCRKTNDAQHHAIMALYVIYVPSVRLLRVGLRQQGAITWGRCYFAAKGDFRPGAATFAMSWNPPAGRLFQWGDFRREDFISSHRESNLRPSFSLWNQITLASVRCVAPYLSSWRLPVNGWRILLRLFRGDVRTVAMVTYLQTGTLNRSTFGHHPYRFYLVEQQSSWILIICLSNKSTFC